MSEPQSVSIDDIIVDIESVINELRSDRCATAMLITELDVGLIGHPSGVFEEKQIGKRIMIQMRYRDGEEEEAN